MRTFFYLLLLGLFSVSSPALALFSNSSQNVTLGSNNHAFVTVDKAFPLQHYQDSHQVLLDWQIKEGYYLYQDRMSFTAENVQIDAIDMPDGQPYHDEFFGDVHIYTQPLLAEISLRDFQDGAKLIVQYQGCAKSGFCYPPETRIIDVHSFHSVDPSAANSQAKISKPAPASIEKQPATPEPSASSDVTLADKIDQHWWTPLLFLALGIGLAFTPCVLPMYPILTGIVLGSGKLSPRRAFTLAMIYVQGMALTYTLLGLVVASAGMQFQAAMQHPYILAGLSVLFVVLAMSMFGVYNLQLPSQLQTRLNQWSNQQKGGNTLGVFIMGAISGLVCSPCTTAPLSGALLYVAQSGDVFTGAITLYALAIGMGIPLILVAVFGNKLLPKAGGWMEKVKIVFGFILLAAPIFLLERLLPPIWITGLWAALGVVAFGWLYHAKNALQFGGWKQSVVGIIAILGLFASMQPLLTLWLNPTEHSVNSSIEVDFIQIKTVEDLQQQLQLAQESNQPVMLDFYADWCVACKEFEKYTFHHPDVAKQLSGFVLLQADVTKNLPQDIRLLEHLRVLGLPTIEFWSATGEHLPNARIAGFMQAEPFLNHLNNHYE
ncbi:protein-disulfide reductase DsbD [Vibrio sp. 10N.286.49.B3]|uniref:protein-disulfide reductase DsbD n=1 Tax=Vibrio sp. 10N.286.49.B3 TaxID=1880855 RepID=UPI000C8349E6|nr:protein-disulfide reductase DsbD [Vibrio sp. 10N.286.49.B3]PMH46242.1 protein-disulfide reductase DsbD [Vibrio sp. 10N.286.49.B3]